MKEAEYGKDTHLLTNYFIARDLKKYVDTNEGNNTGCQYN